MNDWNHFIANPPGYIATKTASFLHTIMLALSLQSRETGLGYDF
jgi:hypothetical protein